MSRQFRESVDELANLLLDGEIDADDLRRRHAIGVEVEGEHTDDPKEKAHIARTHERENKRYYPNKPKPKGKKEALRWVESEGPCPNCHTAPEGRRKELADLGWKQRGWGYAEWSNPPGTYYVHDEVIDQIPEDEWDYIKRTTNARLPSDVKGPRPQAKTLGDYEQERQDDLPGMPRPKAQVIGDQTTIGM